MGFLKRFFKNVFHEHQRTEHDNSFDMLASEDLETHLRVDRYGDFRLTDAVRPSYDLKITPRQGYRRDTYRDEQSGSAAPVIMAAASREGLFDLFIDMLDPLGANVDVVLETSHNRTGDGHTDLYREHIDMPVLKSILYDFEDLLLNDGCTGIAVLNPGIPQEVQFDEHKLLIAYGEPLSAFSTLLEEHGVRRNDELKFITEAEHVHSSTEEHYEQFQELRMRLGMDCMFGEASCH